MHYKLFVKLLKYWYVFPAEGQIIRHDQFDYDDWLYVRFMIRFDNVGEMMQYIFQLFIKYWRIAIIEMMMYRDVE